MTTDAAAAADLGILTGRVAGAPISWGVCEVPGWGYQLPVDQVLSEMAQVGLVATELGPDGFLPTEPEEAARVLSGHGLACVGGFMPVRLHAVGRSDGGPDDPVAAEVAQRVQQLVRSGADTMVLAADTGLDSYDTRPQLDDDGWRRLLSRLDNAAQVASEAGITATLHPHVGTLIENGAEVDRLLDGCGIGLCLDTGHLFVGGADVHALARRGPKRVAHVHLKDVRAGLADQVRSGAVAYGQAVKDGLFVPLGEGDVGIAEVVSTLERSGYRGWYVLEQDVVLAEGSPSPVEGVARSLDHLAAVADSLAGKDVR